VRERIGDRALEAPLGRRRERRVRCEVLIEALERAKKRSTSRSIQAPNRSTFGAAAATGQSYRSPMCARIFAGMRDNRP
jgi:hypothetical protein